MKNTEIKLKITDGGLNTLHLIMNAFQGILDQPMQYHTIEISKDVHLDLIKEALSKLYMDDITIREGATGGCYGARDGKDSEGLTVWVDASQLAARCLYEGQEYANIHHTIADACGELVKNREGVAFDGDDLEQVFEDAGHEWKRDNSYNWSGQGHEVEFIFDFDFAVCETEKKALLSIKYHCGGDPRGNYTRKVVYAFDSIEDLYSAIMPCKMLSDDEE